MLKDPLIANCRGFFFLADFFHNAAMKTLEQMLDVTEMHLPRDEKALLPEVAEMMEHVLLLLSSHGKKPPHPTQPPIKKKNSQEEFLRKSAELKETNKFKNLTKIYFLKNNNDNANKKVT